VPFLLLISAIISLYVWVVIIGVVLSWLMMFGIINSRNDFVQGVSRFCYQLTEPALQRIRRYIKPINGLDLSPIVLLLGLEFVRNCVLYYGPRLLGSVGL